MIEFFKLNSYMMYCYKYKNVVVGKRNNGKYTIIFLYNKTFTIYNNTDKPLIKDVLFFNVIYYLLFPVYYFVLFVKINTKFYWIFWKKYLTNNHNPFIYTSGCINLFLSLVGLLVFIYWLYCGIFN